MAAAQGQPRPKSSQLHHPLAQSTRGRSAGNPPTTGDRARCDDSPGIGADPRAVYRRLNCPPRSGNRLSRSYWLSTKTSLIPDSMAPPNGSFENGDRTNGSMRSLRSLRLTKGSCVPALPESRQWYVNTQKQTFVIVEGGEFLMGSPKSERRFLATRHSAPHSHWSHFRNFGA